MIANLPAESNQHETKIESFVDTLLLWIKNKKTGKLDLEFNLHQGSISTCYVKTESKI